MCGRYILKADVEACIRLYGFDPRSEFSETKIDPFKGLGLFGPRYNIAPSEMVPMVRQDRRDEREIIREGRAGRELAAAIWGLMGHGGDKRRGYRIARGETVATSPAFRDHFRRRRCILPASGFYEWQKLPDGPKQPWLIEPVGAELMSMAGLWEVWQDPVTGELQTRCCIITTTANELMAPIHDRMPVILDRADVDRWLAADTGVEDLQAMLRPCQAEWLKATKVSRKVNNARYKGEDVIEPLQDDLFE